MINSSPSNWARRQFRTNLFSTVLLGAMLTVGSVKTSAATVTVQELSTNPRRTVTIDVENFYYGGAYAGVVNLLVEDVATVGFCIDPFHFSSHNALEYEVIPLSEAPKAYNPFYSGEMGAAKAEKISKLWAMAYAPFASTIGNSAAAAIQIAIWEIVAGDDFTVVGSDYGASLLLQQLASYTGEAAHLVALSGPGQDYVVERVPEAGATVLLLSMGLCAMGLLRRFRGNYSPSQK